MPWYILVFSMLSTLLRRRRHLGLAERRESANVRVARRGLSDPIHSRIMATAGSSTIVIARCGICLGQG